MGVAQNYKARDTRVLVFGSIYQGAMLVHVAEPRPNGKRLCCFPGSKLVQSPGFDTVGDWLHLSYAIFQARAEQRSVGQVRIATLEPCYAC